MDTHYSLRWIALEQPGIEAIADLISTQHLRQPNEVIRPGTSCVFSPREGMAELQVLLWHLDHGECVAWPNHQKERKEQEEEVVEAAVALKLKERS